MIKFRRLNFIIFIILFCGGGIFFSNLEVSADDCLDSDKGNNDIFQKGYRVNNEESAEDYGQENWDFCIDNPDINIKQVVADRAKEVEECQGEDCYVIEYQCDSALVYKGVRCLNGCSQGQCLKDAQTIEIEANASLLYQGQLDNIFSGLKEKRDINREKQAQNKYLVKLNQGAKQLSQNIENALNNFITYGVDNNTKKLGAGERAAVIYSFKSAFNKLPETEDELADAIKIANGRWPSITSQEAENRAKEQFQKIYKKVADMNDPKDNAAITVMAYGLRQKAENRNLDSEKAGINIFKNIYGYNPDSTEDWNIMQAVTYSGATRETDTDGDLLVDRREAELGTDPNNKDSDGDGYLDGIEVANGYDPLGG